MTAGPSSWLVSTVNTLKGIYLDLIQKSTWIKLVTFFCSCRATSLGPYKICSNGSLLVLAKGNGIMFLVVGLSVKFI